MSYLSEALSRYYIKEKNYIRFMNGETLSTLSLHMWERLGYGKIDASVVSRVLKGERLFTPLQLETFCQALSLPKKEKLYLFSCLSTDYFARDNIYIDSLSSTDSLDIIEQVTKRIERLFYQGKSQQVIEQGDTLITIYEKLPLTALSRLQKRVLFESYGYFLFLKGRSIAGVGQPKDAIPSIASLTQTLTHISSTYSLLNLSAYADILSADSWYIAGSTPPLKKSYLQKAIDFAQQGFLKLDKTHHETLAALRIIAASACYIRDESVIHSIERLTNTYLPLQSPTYAVNATHLSKMITKGKVLLGDADPFSLEEKVLKHFGKVPQNDNMYFELSDLKTRLETFSFLKLRDSNILMPLIQRGLEISGQSEYPRHKLFFQKQLKLLN